ncbi:MAG: cytochrome b/b6 domain-containing protein [Gammaproteobacteria bacterium]|nr:cytochrome b/b6 domain-containing protein [Gammaproteobacteria bacterium]
MIVWDLPVRLGHWALVALVAAAWWTGETGRLDWHRWGGYALLGVLVFRVYWGFFGSPAARFAGFLKGPRAIIAYLRARTHAPSPGHTPPGGLSVLTLLSLLIAQVGLGLFAVDVDGIESGPLSHWVSFETGRTCAGAHHVLFNVLLAFIGLHIAAIAWYRLVRGENLLATMIHGRRELPPGTSPAPARLSMPALIVGVALAAAVVWYVSSAG